MKYKKDFTQKELLRIFSKDYLSRQGGVSEYPPKAVINSLNLKITEGAGKSATRAPFRKNTGNTEES